MAESFMGYLGHVLVMTNKNGIFLCEIYHVLESEGLGVADHLAFGVSDTIRVIGDGIHDFNDIAAPAQNAAAALLRYHDYVDGCAVAGRDSGMRY
jgi:hypothetical protein